MWNHTNPFLQCKRKATISNVKQFKNARKNIAKTKVYTHWSRVSDTVPILYNVEQIWWSQLELMILTMVKSGSQIECIRYHQWLRVCSKSEGWSGIYRKLMVGSGVDDTIIDSGSQLGQISYHQLLRICSESEGWSGINRKLRVVQTQWNLLYSEQYENNPKAKRTQNETRWKWNRSEAKQDKKKIKWTIEFIECMDLINFK